MAVKPFQGQRCLMWGRAQGERLNLKDEDGWEKSRTSLFCEDKEGIFRFQSWCSKHLPGPDNWHKVIQWFLDGTLLIK